MTTPTAAPPAPTVDPAALTAVITTATARNQVHRRLIAHLTVAIEKLITQAGAAGISCQEIVEVVEAHYTKHGVTPEDLIQALERLEAGKWGVLFEDERGMCYRPRT